MIDNFLNTVGKAALLVLALALAPLAFQGRPHSADTPQAQADPIVFENVTPAPRVHKRMDIDRFADFVAEISSSDSSLMATVVHMIASGRYGDFPLEFDGMVEGHHVNLVVYDFLYGKVESTKGVLLIKAQREDKSVGSFQFSVSTAAP